MNIETAYNNFNDLLLKWNGEKPECVCENITYDLAERMLSESTEYFDESQSNDYLATELPINTKKEILKGYIISWLIELIKSEKHIEVANHLFKLWNKTLEY